MKVAIIYTVLCTLCAMKRSYCLKFIDLPFTQASPKFNEKQEQVDFKKRSYPPIRSTTEMNYLRRHFLDHERAKTVPRAMGYEDEKDDNLKYKISTLVQQTVHDTERKVRSIDHIKGKHREDAPYKAGFILSMIKKTRDVLNELFNVAVKHKDEWKALEQLKIFELIVHTNVDTTNLVRQLVEIHIQYLNSTSTEGGAIGRKRVVLLK